MSPQGQARCPLKLCNNHGAHGKCPLTSCCHFTLWVASSWGRATTVPTGATPGCQVLVVGVVPIYRGLHCNCGTFPPLSGAVPHHLVSWKVPGGMVKGALISTDPDESSWSKSQMHRHDILGRKLQLPQLCQKSQCPNVWEVPLPFTLGVRNTGGGSPGVKAKSAAGPGSPSAGDSGLWGNRNEPT